MSGKIYVNDGELFKGFVDKNDNKPADFFDKRMRSLDLKNKAQDIELRRKYAEQIFTFVSLYMFAVFFIIILSGSPSSFKISDAVLITLLGTTTANVIGVLVIVAKYLFPKK